MLVSHKNRFVYTKTVKTGGTSVESYFEPFCMNEGEWELLHARDEYVSESGVVGFRGVGLPVGTRWWNHMPAALIKERLGDDLWSSYLKFCIIRNPFEKAASMFYYGRHNGFLKVDEGLEEPAQFESWLASPGPPIDRDKYFVDGRLCIDFFVRYENLHEDLERVCARLKLPWEPSRLPTFKSGFRPRGRTIGDLYTSKAREMVEAAYEFELDYFGYSFPAREQ
jgi:hypothetical protein